MTPVDPVPVTTPAEITARLVVLNQEIEGHRTAIWLLEDERLQLQHQWRALTAKPERLAP